MNTQALTKTIATIPGVKEIHEITYIIPNMPTTLEAILPNNYAVEITIHDDQYEVRFENRPNAQHRWDDTDYCGDPETFTDLDTVAADITSFIARH